MALENEKTTTQDVIDAVESAAVNIAEAGIAGGVHGAEVAAIGELAKGAGEVAAIIVDNFKSDPEPTFTGTVTTSAPPDSTFVLIEQWASDRNLIKGSNPQAQTLKGMSELGELADAVLKKDMPNIIDGIGDVCVVLTILAAQNGLKITDCIDAAYNEIKDRKGVMYNGAFIKSDDARYPAIIAELKEAKSGN